MSQDGKYQKQRLIGSGDRVDVFLGLNVAFGRKVAIKELRGNVETSTTERNSFYAEYEKWAKLENIRIARIEDIDRTRAWVIQEYLPQSITELAVGFPGNPAAAYTALEQILEGLAFLHAAGFIHCNLKSSNVRAANDTIKLCDGRCVPIGFPGSLPKPRGSNRYLAPEMINEEFGNVGTASDIYVAGMIMLESLAGEQFETLFKGYVSGTPDTEMGWVRWHNSPETLDPVHTSLPFVPAALATFIDGMICKQVAVRYASADRLLTELRAQREEIVNAKPAPGASNAATAANPAPQSTGNPQAIAPRPAAASTPAKTDKADNKVKLIDRPISQTYVRCLSGTLAGSIFPTSMSEILIGEGSQCAVRISSDHYPAIAGREIKISLGGNGWQISDTREHPLIVDSKTSFQIAPLRSGSIFRLSPRGPDFQFIVQGQHDATWQDIAAELELVSAETNVPTRLLEKAKRRPASTSGPSVPTPPNPISAAPARPQPVPQGKSKPTHAAPAKPPAAPSAPARPSAQPTAAPAAPLQTDSTPKPSMDKNKRNNLILFISLPIMAILIIVFMPRSKPATPTDKDDQAEVETADGEPKTEQPSTDSDPAPAGEATPDKNPPEAAATSADVGATQKTEPAANTDPSKANASDDDK